MLPEISIKIFLAKGERDHNKMNTQYKPILSQCSKLFSVSSKIYHYVYMSYSGRSFRSCKYSLKMTIKKQDIKNT